jgi:hypothetical protein
MSTPISVSNTSGSGASLPAELPMQDDSTDANQATIAAESAKSEDSTAHYQNHRWSNSGRWLICGTAVGYYMSALLHVLGYGVAVLAFYLLGISFLPEEDWVKNTIQASLDDQVILDDAAKIELTPEINLGLEQQNSAVQELARQLMITDAGWIDSLQNDALTAMSSADSDKADAASGNGFMFQVPKSGFAVTKGSFTAWAEPNAPKPGQRYLIVIEVRLPNDIKRYRTADLVGEVKGSDKYRQRIPYDKVAPTASAASTTEGLKIINRSSVLDVVNNKVQLIIRVPGAARMVRDTISIRSRRLREEQELVLIFGDKPRDDK